MSLVGRTWGNDATERARPRWLDACTDPDPDELGGKATALIRARAAGLPALDGFVIPVSATGLDPILLRPDWGELSEDGHHPLVVRSSSPVEDGEVESMAGVFDSVIDVRGWPAFVDAVETVVESGAGAPMAVLVQRMITPQLGGVLFGADPVTGRDDRWLIATVDGGPHRLVDGSTEAAEVVVDRYGRVQERRGARDPQLPRRRRHALVDLERQSRRVFGSPQDIEWAELDGSLVLLQSRPITTKVSRADGPLLGPGPVAETLPDPLDPLELDLWVPPLRDAMDEVLALLGRASRRRLARSSALRVVDRQVAVDLELTDPDAVGRRSLLSRLDPRPSLRRLRGAWRLGRLRAAMPVLGRSLIERIDGELEEIPDLASLTDTELLHALVNASHFLRSAHAHEMLAGALAGDEGASSAEAALLALGAGRTRGWSDEEIAARTPVVLALVTPRIAGPRRLPALDGDGVAVVPELSLREALRLRVRWLHELTRAAGREAGARLIERRQLADVDEVTRLGVAALEIALHGGPVLLADRPEPVSPLPARFRLAPGDVVVADTAGEDAAGTPAGGGRGSGRVVHGDPAAGDVLVVRTLDPSLAASLPGLSGLIAETGSTLSHLAILAREQGVPVVVGVNGARARYTEGTVVHLDGSTGVIDVVESVEGVRA